MRFVRATLGGALAILLAAGAPVAAQSPTDLTGSWRLNRQQSQFPDELGFSADVGTAGAGAQPRAGRGGGRGGRRDSGDGNSRFTEGLRGPLVPPESQEDAQRVRFLTDEVRLPPESLTITVTPALVTIVPDRGAARTLQPGRREDGMAIGPVTAQVTASWDADRLSVVYDVESGRSIRYTYSRTLSPPQLVVETEFVGRGGGDRVRRVYDSAPLHQPTESLSSAAGGAPPAPLPRLTLPPGALPPGMARPAASVPALPEAGPAAVAVDQRPDAPLRGLSRLGIVIEGVGADAAKCGLKEDTFEAAVTKHLTDAGFRVLKNTDDDTYLYVNVNTVNASATFCVARYDVTLYSHATAPLAHTTAPVPLQVELLHKGGLAGGGPGALGDAVTKNVLEYVDEFTTRVRSANRP